MSTRTKRTAPRAKYTAAQRAAYAARMRNARAKTIKFIPTRSPVVGKPLKGYGRYRREESNLASAGAELGRWLGRGADKVVKTLFGFGDYHVEHNTLMSGGLSPPEMVNSISNGGFILRHREYICDIEATQAFTNQSFFINPALFESFPWLAAVASAFEEYEFRGLVYEFKSMSSDTLLSTSANTALGTVVMATQYNSLNPPFVDKVTMENYEFANSNKPSCSFLHPVECKRSLTPVTHLYTRSGPPAVGGDIRLYDLGEFQIATQGMQADGGVIGELWATFEIEFFKPKLQSDADRILSSRYHLNNVTNTNPLGGTAPTEVAGSSLPLTIGLGTITWPETIESGEYLINWNVIGSSTGSLLIPTITATTNCTIPDRYAGDTVDVFHSQNGITGTSSNAMFHVIVTGPGARITFDDNGTLPASVTSGDLIVTQLNENLQLVSITQKNPVIRRGGK